MEGEITIRQVYEALHEFKTEQLNFNATVNKDLKELIVQTTTTNGRVTALEGIHKECIGKLAYMKVKEIEAEKNKDLKDELKIEKTSKYRDIGRVVVVTTIIAGFITGIFYLIKFTI